MAETLTCKDCPESITIETISDVLAERWEKHSGYWRCIRHADAAFNHVLWLSMKRKIADQWHVVLTELARNPKKNTKPDVHWEGLKTVVQRMASHLRDGESPAAG